MADRRQLIQYQRDCYEADNREVGIKDLFQSKIRHLRFFEGEEVALCGTIERVPLPQKVAERVRKDAYKYRRDKTLVYAAFPVVGGHKLLKMSGQNLCAPLLYFPAEIEDRQGEAFLVPDLADCRFNIPVMGELAELEGLDDEALLRAVAQLPEPPWPRSRVHDLAAAFAEVLPMVDFTGLSVFPMLNSEAEVREYCETVKKRLLCLPAAAMGLLANSPDTRGVLFELGELASSSEHSSALKALLDSAGIRRSRFSQRPSLAPSILSEAQEKAVRLARTSPMTYVVGPPGTGKSHTIASIALDHLANNQSVLVASRMDQAVNVVADKIEEMIGESGAIVRAGRKQYLRQLKDSLENLLSGIGVTQQTAGEARRLHQQLRKLTRDVVHTEDRVDSKHQLELAWGGQAAKSKSGWFSHWEGRFWQGWREWQLRDFDGWNEVETYLRLLQQRSQLSRKFLQQVLAERTAKLLKRRRQDLSHLLQALSARSDGKQREFFSKVDFAALLHAFPIWLCKLTELSNVLPLREELFDLAILDEATQCDIASCLPLLQRAKRVVIVGDPKQLRHLSFLSEARQQSIASTNAMLPSQEQLYHFRNRSILDVAGQVVEQEQVVYLNEHFRSLPAIIAFSNREFYSDTLRVMRKRPVAKQDCVHLRRVEGQRSASGGNSTEAESLVAVIRERIHASDRAAECHGLPERGVSETTELPPTIGVLSPFRQQVELLAKHLDKALSLDEMIRHDLLVGTAHAFQGEERDIMFLSLALDDQSHGSSYRFLSQPNLLNVSITRARHEQWVFHSFTPERVPTDYLLRHWIESIRGVSPVQQLAHLRSEDRFRRELWTELETYGLQCWGDYEIAGITVDLVISQGDGNYLGIDLIGYPGALAEAYSLERYRVLFRSSFPIMPLSYRAWKSDSRGCLQRILMQLEGRHSSRHLQARISS